MIRIRKFKIDIFLPIDRDVRSYRLYSLTLAYPFYEHLIRVVDKSNSVIEASLHLEGASGPHKMAKKVADELWNTARIIGITIDPPNTVTIRKRNEIDWDVIEPKVLEIFKEHFAVPNCEFDLKIYNHNPNQARIHPDGIHY